MDDGQTIAFILSGIENVDVSNLDTRRLGKVDLQKGPSLILFNMRSSQEALRVVRNKRLLPKGVEVSLDKTAAQRKHLKALMAEVDAHNESHPNSPKTIKYRNNVPVVLGVEASTIRSFRRKHAKQPTISHALLSQRTLSE